MNGLNANKIPLAHDVWRTLEGFLKTGMEDVEGLTFNFHAAERQTIIHLKTKKDFKEIKVQGEESDDLIMNLCGKFNIPQYSLSSLEFTLNQLEIPIFNISLYPYVNDTSELTLPRFNRTTLDAK